VSVQRIRLCGATESGLLAGMRRVITCNCSNCFWRGYRTLMFLVDLGSKPSYKELNESVKGLASKLRCPRCGGRVLFHGYPKERGCDHRSSKVPHVR
jgi:DNA-directed RNA polymerase subunit RPC12/RpoP